MVQFLYSGKSTMRFDWALEIMNGAGPPSSLRIVIEFGRQTWGARWSGLLKHWPFDILLFIYFDCEEMKCFYGWIFGRFTAYGQPHGEPHICIFYYKLSKREFVTRTWFVSLLFPSSFVITARYVLIDLIRKSTSHKYTEESWKNLGNLTRWRALDLSLYFWIIKIKESLEVFVVIILFFARTNIITSSQLAC